MRRLFRRLIVLAAPLAAAAAVGGLLLASGAAIGLERGLGELRDAARARPASGEVHIVEIDRRSIDAIQAWPWPRSYHGAAVDRLREAGARTIAFDVDFSSPQSNEEDARFAAALQRAGGAVILPTFHQQAGAGRGEIIDAAPIPILAEQAFLATANVIADEDGTLRRMPTGGETLGIPRPSLASLVAERTASADSAFAIDYAVDPATIPRHSFIDLIEGRLDPRTLAGRRVIIGSTAVELGDHYPSPRHGMLPGAVIQALAAETLIAGSERRPLGGGPALLFALSVVAASLLLRPRARLATLATTALALPGLGFAADLGFARSLEIVPAGAALAVAAVFAAVALRRQHDRERSRSDAESGLPNLAALEDAAAALPAARILVARIGGFAALSATLGPQEVAQLLVRIADRLRLGAGVERVYRSDETGLAWIAPGSGEGSGEASLDGLAAFVRDQLAGDRRIEVPLHFGIAAGAGSDVRRLAANAALAAMQAERAGKRWHAFTERDSTEIGQAVALMGDLDDGLRSGTIYNHYQPKLDLASGRITGVEALARWQHPRRGLLGPDYFVPLIEEHGRARDLTLHVLRDVIADEARWREEGVELGVAINVTAGLLADDQFMAELCLMVARSGLAPGRLTIEVTETAAMNSPEAAIAALESWRRLGGGVSIDDFGTGQSSLGYIRMLPATELKIDRSFVADCARAPRNAIMVRSTIAMAHELGLVVVAEGVEDEACLAALAQMGCDVVQGYLVARPISADGIADMVRGLEAGRARPSAAVSGS
jgi:EAL domain-containing protein (putative c-di-GMP-specific phosphodiesterase class I)/CHASE2 domain-containing sensor protein